MPSPTSTDIHYTNALNDVVFEPDKPIVSSLLSNEGLQLKRVALHAGTSLSCHASPDTVIVTCLRGKGQFTAEDVPYVMQPGSVLHMPANTPHSALADTDCVFIVCKIKV